MFIYKITNTVNGKIYIGQTRNSIQTRWLQHVAESKRSTSALASAIKKYGRDSFKIEELETCTSLEELNTLEKTLIREYESLSPKGYNLREGGDQPRLSSESIEKIRKSMLGKKPSPENARRLGDYSRGKKQSAEHVSKRFKSRDGWKHSDKSKEKIARNKGGRSFSVYKDDVFIGNWDVINQCAKDLDLSNSHICSCLKGRLRQHKGHVFRYLEQQAPK
jgi:group I intron endonuclease